MYNRVGLSVLDKLETYFSFSFPVLPPLHLASCARAGCLPTGRLEIVDKQLPGRRGRRCPLESMISVAYYVQSPYGSSPEQTPKPEDYQVSECC